MQAFRKGSKRLILFDEVDVYTPIERDVAGQKQIIPSLIQKIKDNVCLPCERNPLVCDLFVRSSWYLSL